MFNVVKIIISFFILILLNACAPSEYTSNDASTNDTNDSTTGEVVEDRVSGTVVDGYINSASVCLDLNINGLCESDEPTSQTDSNGIFNFLLSDLNQSTLLPIIASGGIDTSTDKAFIGQLLSVIDASATDANSSIIVSPITDLVGVSFFESLNKDALALSDAKSNVATALGINIASLELDPMKEIEIFSISQEIQHTKELLHNTTSSTTADFATIQRHIKKEIIAQNLDIDRMIIAIQIDLDYTIPTNQIIFLEEQIAELQNSLGTLTNNTSLEISNLNRYQESLDNLLEPVNLTLSTADGTTVLDVVTIDITTESITQSIFNARDAVLDAQACEASNGYQELISTSFLPDSVSDTTNGILLKSTYSFGTGLSTAEVKIFYTDLETTPIDEDVIIFEDNYYFAFDQTWTLNSNKTIYIQTPVENDGLYSCYRYELNSIGAGSITFTKVYRYTDL